MSTDESHAIGAVALFRPAFAAGPLSETASGEGAVLLDGRMIDRPIEDRARRWLAR
jgi:citrate lyase beta subunit